jgi:hypothetical protein
MSSTRRATMERVRYFRFWRPQMSYTTRANYGNVKAFQILEDADKLYEA